MEEAQATEKRVLPAVGLNLTRGQAKVMGQRSKRWIKEVNAMDIIHLYILVFRLQELNFLLVLKKGGVVESFRLVAYIDLEVLKIT